MGRMLFAYLVFACLVAPLCGMDTPEPAPAPVDEYQIHADGGIIYNPLELEALKTGQLGRYRDRAGFSEFQMASHEGVLQLSLATQGIHEYDVIPIHYSVKSAGDTFAGPVAVEAVAFEDAARRNGQDLFDLSLPGAIDFDVEYLGSITAHTKQGARHNITADFSDTPKEYPPFVRRPLVHSGVVEAGDLVWFKVKYTNTGNTIVDPEGLGGIIFMPKLLRKGDNGDYQPTGEPYNVYLRDPCYVYPGESREMWIHCAGSVPGYAEQDNGTPQGFGLVPGEYILQFNIAFRDYRYTDNIVQNLSDGTLVYRWEMPFKIEQEARQAPVQPAVEPITDSVAVNKMTDFIHTFQEFMTAFDCHLDAATRNKIEGTLFLQVAPWTEHVVVKMITADPVTAKTIVIPVEVLQDDKIAYQEFPNAAIIKDGRREPVIFTQSMVDARSNVGAGPFVETHIRENLQEMRDCGANVIGTMAMPWLYNDMHQPRSNYQGDSLKYVLDLARVDDIPIEGFGGYPFDRATLLDQVAWIRGQDMPEIERVSSQYTAISLAEPSLPDMQADLILYQFRRWGDTYYQMENGDVPIGMEDTRGWMRVDVNVRYPMGPKMAAAFREWLKQKYGTIARVNQAWGSDFPSFEQIDPEAGQQTNVFGHRLEYLDPSNVFHDWNKAVLDLDDFRTQVRVENYRRLLALLRQEIPGACLALRTEGANFMAADIDPQTPNPHFRHVYFSQRRCGLVAPIIHEAGVVKYHGDYITIPYTPSEVRQLVRDSVRGGVIPMHLPQFDNMRDMAVNDRYGSDYQRHYNLPIPKKAYMMHCLAALYPWFKATYEEGGIPGVLWEDFQCDGFVTETQKREMKIYHAKLRTAMEQQAARVSSHANIHPPDQSWRGRSKALRSYRIDEK